MHVIQLELRFLFRAFYRYIDRAILFFACSFVIFLPKFLFSIEKKINPNIWAVKMFIETIKLETNLLQKSETIKEISDEAELTLKSIEEVYINCTGMI